MTRQCGPWASAVNRAISTFRNVNLLDNQTYPLVAVQHGLVLVPLERAEDVLFLGRHAAAGVEDVDGRVRVAGEDDVVEGQGIPCGSRQLDAMGLVRFVRNGDRSEGSYRGGEMQL